MALWLWKTGPRTVPVRARRARRFLNLARYNVLVAYVIREFKPEDFETLWRMDQECFPPGISYSKPELKSYIRRRGAVTLVARDAEGKAAGFIVVHAGSTGHVITIDVMAAARRLGVGSLLAEVCGRAPACGRIFRRGSGNGGG